MASSITDFIIRVRVQGQQLVDKLTKSSNDLEKGMTDANKATSKFDGAIKGLGSSVTGMVGGVAGLATAFAGLGMRTISAADQIQDLSDATGIGAGRLLNFKQSLIEAGGKTEDFEKMSAKLNQTLGDAAQGNEKVRKTFRDLGVSLGDANGKLRSTDELLPEILNALKQIDDPATRAATAVDLLGKSANKIDWTKVSAINDPFKDAEIAQLAKYQSKLDEIANTIQTKLITGFGQLAIAMEEPFKLDSLQTFNAYLTKLIHNIPGMETASKFGNYLGNKVADIIGMPQRPLPLDIVPSKAGAGRGFVNPPNVTPGGTGDLAITEAGQQAIANAKAQTDAMRQTNAIQNQYATKLNETLGLQQYAGDIARSNLNIEKERDLKLADINKQIETELNNKERDSRVTKGIVDQLREQGVEVIRQADAMKTAKQTELQQLQYQKDLMADILLLNQTLTQNVQLHQLSNQNQLIGLFGEELQQQQGLMNIENERVNAVLAARNKYEALGKNATSADAKRLQTEISQAQSAANMKVAILEDQMAREKALREDATKGSQQAADAIAKQYEAFNKAGMQTQAVWSGMSNAIDTFVDTGKFKFSDFARSVIQDLIKIELKAQATSLLKSVGGFTGILSSIAGFFSGRAAGGPVSANTPYVVGEKGPELFMPNTAGKIIPNGGSVGGGAGAVNAPITNNYITNNISAIDSKSVAQLFAENRKTLLGTVELARKELPYATGR